MSEVDGVAHTPAIPQPPVEFESIQEVFKSVYAHEQKVTRSINNIMTLAEEEKDYTTIHSKKRADFCYLKEFLGNQ